MSKDDRGFVLQQVATVQDGLTAVFDAAERWEDGCECSCERCADLSEALDDCPMLDLEAAIVQDFESLSPQGYPYLKRTITVVGNLADALGFLSHSAPVCAEHNFETGDGVPEWEHCQQCSMRIALRQFRLWKDGLTDSELETLSKSGDAVKSTAPRSTKTARDQDGEG